MAGPLTTAPLTAGLKTSIGADDETETKYQQALAELMNRLDTRKNRLFDPTLLAMAQGFLGPTKTGNFGEALGRVAEKVGTAQSQQEKEDLDIAQMRLQIAQSAREQAAQMQGQKAFRGLLNGTGGGAGAPAGAPATPAEGEPAAPSAGAPATPSAGAPAGKPLTMDQVLAFRAAYPTQKALGDALEKAVEFNSNRYKIAQNGTVFDTVTSQYIAQLPPGQTASDFFVPDAGGTVKMTPGQYDAYQKARASGKGKDWVNKFFETEPGKAPDYLTQELITQRAEERKQTPSKYVIEELGGEVSMTPSEYQGYVAARMKGKEAVAEWIKSRGKSITSGDIAAREAAKRREEEDVAKANADRYNAAIAKGNDAGSRITQYKLIEATAQKPDANKIFGVFENGKFSDALFNLLETNKGVISVPEIRKIWTNLGLDPKLIADKQLALSLIAQSQFAFRGLAKGQGSISNFEQQLFAAMGPEIADRPETVVKKAQMLQQMAEFDKTVAGLAKKARKNGIDYDDLKDSEEYAQAYQSHINKLMNIVASSGAQVPAAPSGTPARPASAPASRPASRPNPAANDLRRQLGI
jgi:hypothetical protein